MSLIIVQRPHLSPPAAGSGLIDIGAVTVNATSFNINPQARGAANGDTMVVFSLWEDDSAVSTPSGWTNIVDKEAPALTTARWHGDKIKFSGTPPSSVTWSYSGGSGVAYVWAIVRGVTTVGTLTELKNDIQAPGLFGAISITAGTTGALVFTLADGVSETGNINVEDRFTNMDSIAFDASVTARTAMIGWTTTSETTNFDTDDGSGNATKVSQHQVGWLPLS